MGLKQLPDDFRDFIQLLNLNNVRYLLIGGWAVGIYGFPRATKDIDFLISVDDDNLKNILKSLADFGAPTIEPEIIKHKGKVLRIGRSPIQIDILNEASGIHFSECYERKMVITIEGIDIFVISKSDLIINKRASGRTRDQADAEMLEES